MKLSEIADLVSGTLRGDGGIEISGIAPLETAGDGDVSFLANPRYQSQLKTTQAAALLLPEGEWPVEQPVIICKNPYFGFALLMQHFHQIVQKQAAVIHPAAQIADDVQFGANPSIGAFVVIGSGVRLGDNVTVFPGCYIGKNCKTGNDVTLYSHVMLREEVEIGDRVIIHSGSVLGSDGFGFAQEKGVYHKIPQIGRVVIEDDVEIGANCCIDRATLGETRIHRGTKLDNLIQIAHNVKIGEHSVIAGQTGISGSTQVGHHAMFGGQVGIIGHITIGDYVICGAQAGVTKSIPDKGFVSGYPARPHKEHLKIEAAAKKLPEMLRRLHRLEEKIARLEKQNEV
ncbi:MAG TPA: UDP-3-O-(3-hydroxymyristoyl)glucosamine N-acyltransferase [Bacteroidetes bacterium]|nr:UDP-3-O-(3-hydroxymyristoyl)glucosamine N-acyltransferase [Bacteroidota bacterium]